MYPVKSYITQKYGDYRHSIGTNQTIVNSVNGVYQSNHVHSAYMPNSINNMNQHTSMGVPSTVNSALSPKYISTKPTTLTKSSKYIVNKTEQSAY